MSDNHPSDTVIQRRRTSPQAKWLLNEAAALRGELKKVQARKEDLAKREAELLKTISALELVVAPLPVPAGVSAPVSINAHTWGERGTLNALLLECLQAAYPKAVDSVSLTDWVAASQNSQLADSAERRSLRKRVTRRLSHLVDQGRVERVTSLGPDCNGAGVWRLAGKKGPTLAELQRRAEELAVEAEAGVERTGGI